MSNEPEQTQPTLKEFLDAVKADNAAVAASMFANMPEPELRYGAVSLNVRGELELPLALFAKEHDAWRWVLQQFHPATFVVRPFMVSAAAVE